MGPDEHYLVFEEGYDWNPDTWYVVNSKVEAIEALVHSNASNVFPISKEVYNEYTKLEVDIAVAQSRMRELENPFTGDALYNNSFRNDPEYRAAYEFNEMWREAHKMNRQFDCKHDWDHSWGGDSKDECRKCWLSRPCESTQTCARWETKPVEPVEPLAEWEKELLGLINKEETNE